MANFFWVGNTGTWNDTAHWSSTSGGTGGAGFPQNGDNATFDANSFSANGFTVTTVTFAECTNLDFSGLTKTINFDLINNVGGNFNVYGDLIGSSKVTFINGGNIGMTPNGTSQNLTTNGMIFSCGLPLFNSGTVNLTDTLTLSGNPSVVGIFPQQTVTFNTNDHTITTPRFYADVASGNPTINLGASTVNLVATGSSSYSIFRLDSGTIFNAGTSNIKVDLTSFTGLSVSFSLISHSYTFYDVQIDGAGVGKKVSISGNGQTFHNFTVINPPVTVDTSNVTYTFSTLTLTGTAASNVKLTSGGFVTFSASTVNIHYVDVQNNTASGAASPFNDFGGTDSGNNVNWLFPAASNAAFLLNFV